MKISIKLKKVWIRFKNIYLNLAIFYPKVKWSKMFNKY